MPVTYAQYCKISGVDASKTSEKAEGKNFDKMKNQSLSDIFGSYGKEALSHFTVNDLKEELSENGLSTSGAKADLIARLEEHYSSDSHKRKSSHKDSSDKKQKTDSSMEVDLEGKNPGNVAGGYKATLHNPNSSEEAKEHARKMLQEMGEDETPKAEQEGEFDLKESLKGKNKGNVVGGYKATLHNPNSSEEAKEHAQEVLDEMGVDADEKVDSSKKSSSSSKASPKKSSSTSSSSKQSTKEVDTEGKNKGNVVGGYKATLKNPNVSDEAKEHAQEVLDEMGEDTDAKSQKKSQGSEDLSNSHVIGGYKATLHNANSSEEAKEHARKMLKEAGVDEDEKADSQKSHGSEDLSNSHVIGGYKATLHNANSSEEAKEHARKMLKEAGVDEDEKVDSRSGDHEKNQNNVAGGYKATLKNPNASQEAKDHAQKMLDEMGVDADDTADSRKTYHEADTHGKNKGNVVGGYKATLKNPNVSDEAKENAEEQLEKLGASADDDSSSSKKSSSASKSKSSSKDDEGKNPNNVAGGYKATLKNPNVSEEAKKHAKEELKASNKL